MEDLDNNNKLNTENNLKRKLSRKDARKEVRAQKKAKRNAHFQNKKNKLKEAALLDKEQSNDELRPKVTNKKRKRKKKKAKNVDQPEVNNVSAIRTKQSRNFKEEEDQEIKDLEKKLKLNKRVNLPKAFYEEGLEDIIDMCNAIESGSLKRQDIDDANDEEVEFQENLFNEDQSSLIVEDESDGYIDDSGDDSDGHKCSQIPAKNRDSASVPFKYDSTNDDQVDDYIEDDDDNQIDDDDDNNPDHDDNQLDDNQDNDNQDDDNDDNQNDDNDNQLDDDNQDDDDQDDDDDEDDDDDQHDDNQNSDIDQDNVYKDDNERDDQDDYYKQEKNDKSDDLCEERTSNDIYGGAIPKYVPPHQRKRNTENSEATRKIDEKLRKQMQGLLNRLSESNLSGVASQIEELYMSNSRNDVNEVLTKLLMDGCITSSLMSDSLLREHAMLVSLLNSRVGSEVGAFLLQKLAVQFHQLHSSDNLTSQSKELHNITTLFALLYSFKVIDCILVYDIIRCLVSSFSEKDIELLLLIIRLIGVEIRRESPESLKEIILQVQSKAAADTELRNTSRTRFMLETINALRNNNMRKIPNYDPAPLERAKKILKTIGQDDSTKLNISLSDLLTANEKGRWWVIGSAWSEREKDSNKTPVSQDSLGNSDMMELARQQRMSTDIRKNIFCTIMSSEDYVDAFEKLLKMKLKSKQSREIIFVLVDCSLQEKSYNPFYSYLIQKFCEFSRSYQVTVQYSFWDRFKMASNLTNSNLTNMAQLLVHLLINKSLSLSVLKVVDFTTLDKKLVMFFTLLLTRLLLDYPEKTVREVFMRIAPLAKLDSLKESLKLFMKHFMKSKRSKAAPNLPEETDDKEKLDKRIVLAFEALTGK